MTQISVPLHFCTQCGTTIVLPQSTCTTCGAKVAMRRSQPGDDTEKVSSANLIFDATTDADATIRASSHLPSYLYMKAAQQHADLTSSEKRSQHDKPQSGMQEQLPTAVRTKKVASKKRWLYITSGFGLALLLFVLVAGIGASDSYVQAQQQTEKSKAELDHSVQQARAAGVSASSLQPLLSQEQQIAHSALPLTLFSNPLGVQIYQHQAQLYHHLQTQIPAILQMATEQAQVLAQQDMQHLQTVLSQANIHPVGNIHYIAQQFSQDQLQLSSAHTLEDYSAISQNARTSIAALTLLAATYQQLTDFHGALDNMQAAHLDVTAMQLQYQNDLVLFNKATQPGDFQNLSVQMNTQYQQLLVISIQTFPYISVVKLNELTTQIQSLHSYNIATAPYQTRLNADQLAYSRAEALNDKLAFLQQVDTDIASMHYDLARGKANSLVAQFRQEVKHWNSLHPYHNSYDHHDYALDNGYMTAGIGATLNGDLANAHSLTDFTAVTVEAENALFNLHASEVDYNDHTPYTQVHATDLQMLSHYTLQKKQVLMVSIVEQALRVYQNGKLAGSYQVTTGRQELPSLPGVWTVLDRKSPIVFTSGEPKNSPYWFPDTPINYAILYHYGGYFVHDAPWRASFGPGTQFPHHDASGNTPYNFDGSHGCINMSESDAAWIYKHTDWNTIIVIY